MSVEVAGEDPIVLDLGTGLRLWGETFAEGAVFRGTALVSHIHWDHVQGLPFFVPILRPGACLDVYGPRQESGSLAAAVDEFLRPPFFPVSIGDLPGTFAFHDVGDADFAVGNAKVRSRSVPHVGPTVGYRIEWDGASIAYVSDHQSPCTGELIEGGHVDERVLELCDGVDLLIHDAQFRSDEWTTKAHWGHCTVDYAVGVARAAGVRRLALFHHDPAHADGEVDAMLDHARELAGDGVEEVLAAYEGLTISLDR